MEERIHELNSQSGLPVCSIIWMMRDTAPDGFFLCDGQTINLTVENDLSIYIDDNSKKHDCSDFVINFRPIGNIVTTTSGDATTRTVTLPDLRGRTCVGPKIYGNNVFTLSMGDSFSGMLPAAASTLETSQRLPTDDKNTTVRTNYKHVFSGAWGYWGDSFATGAFKWIHDYARSAGASSHGGIGVSAIALDIKSLFASSLNNSDVSNAATANKTDLIPSCLVVNPYIKVY